jgi:DNA-binding beta-propeller fold protein YncE
MGNVPLGQFILPTGLAAKDDDLWVGDYAAGLVYQLVKDGVVLATPQPVASELAGPEGLAVFTDGNLLVVESGAGRLSHIDRATGEVTPLFEGLEFGQGFNFLFPFPFIGEDAHNDLSGEAT